ncbi:GDP-mannose-dependent alpha-mannosyltransferase [Lacunisphaera limnophila]|uniref:GDP-mannose-dependent alpha-mannosyltransferase n=1 Tax=Lacunisphaera limnophila TaxID=1838286 RepID=A0A1D8AVS7_9BACT|nr:glycosyltransferase family 4 protein [Lacunisphaera limnophila]AOS44997.1 GDP-mannose-dependent alpha-mannosyltransferase [Lacunisphaera limnophila]
MQQAAHPLRILIITQWFDPEPADVKGLPLARELAKRGHQVSVITGFPNYPGGKVYPGYRIRAWQIEHRDNVRIVRVPLYPSHGQSKLGRILNYVSFAVAASTLGLVHVDRPDVVYVYHPPATVGIPALIARALWGVRWVIDIQDMWPEAISASGMIGNPGILRVIGAFAGYMNRQADRVVVLSPGYKRRLVEQGMPPGKIDVILNWSRLDGAPRATGGLKPEEAEQMAGKFVVLFAGNMGPAQALESVVAAAQLCRDDRSIVFAFVGSGIELPKLRAAAAGLPNVLLLPPRPPREMPALMARADLLLVHLRDNEHYARTIPSKTQDYLAAGRPILMAVRGDAADLITRAGAGTVCAPENPQELAAGVRQIAALSVAAREEMGRAARAFYEQHLSLHTGANAFESVFHSIRRH